MKFFERETGSKMLQGPKNKRFPSLSPPPHLTTAKDGKKSFSSKSPFLVGTHPTWQHWCLRLLGPGSWRVRWVVTLWQRPGLTMRTRHPLPRPLHPRPLHHLRLRHHHHHWLCRCSCWSASPPSPPGTSRWTAGGRGGGWGKVTSQVTHGRDQLITNGTDIMKISK